MKLEVVTPERFLGDVIADISSRRGHIENVEAHVEICNIRALAPLSETFGYATSLRSLTQGRATHSMEFHSYQQLPDEFTDKVKAMGKV